MEKSHLEAGKQDGDSRLRCSAKEKTQGSDSRGRPLSNAGSHSTDRRHREPHHNTEEIVRGTPPSIADHNHRDRRYEEEKEPGQYMGVLWNQDGDSYTILSKVHCVAFKLVSCRC